MRRREFLKTAAIGAAAAAFPAVLHSATSRRGQPNVLFISVDDMNTDGTLWGGTGPQTPYLGRLAQRGVRFSRNYCQYPLCNPSRSSLMTGFRPERTQVFGNGRHFRASLPDVVTLPQLFKNHGYFSARVGKIYHYDNPGGIGTNGLDDAPSWNEVLNPIGCDRTQLMEHAINYTPTHPLGFSISLYADPTGRDEDYTDGMVASNAIRLLEQHRGEPFFLGVGFFKPHCPHIVPQKYFDLYPENSIDVPEMPPNYRDTVPSGALGSTIPWPNFGVTREQARAVKRAYYAATSFVDAQIGRVLAALDRLELRENTIVVFWSDHGFHVGDHGLWHKESCFEQSARVPLIVAAPGVAAAAQPCPRIVEHVNIFPTVAELAGLELPAKLDGVSLRPLLDNPLAPWDRPAFTQRDKNAKNGIPIGHSVRTERWRYTQWDEGRKGEELYDHESDPGEMRNLATDPGHAPVVAELTRLIRQNWPGRSQG